MNPSNPWDDVLARVAAKVNRHSFYTWFKPSSFLSEADDLVLQGARQAAVQGGLGRRVVRMAGFTKAPFPIPEIWCFSTTPGTLMETVN